jgi:sugar-specific transcriptional regulator TrmB
MAHRRDLEEAAAALRKLGLSDYQSKTLSALLILEEATAPQAAELARIPRAKIYMALDELSAMNAVRKKPGRPVRYQVADPADIAGNIIDYMRGRLEKRMQSYETQRAGVEKKIRSISEVRQGDVPRDFIEVVTAGETSILETVRAMENARQDIIVLSNVMEYLPQIHKELVEAAGRGVRLRVLLSTARSLPVKSRQVLRDNAKALAALGAKVRYVRETPLRLTIIDDGFSIYSVREDKEFLYKKDMVISRHKNMINALRKYFEAEWDSALKRP